MSSKRRFLVTAGPTREAIDPVRFISNHSSGRMGIEITQALLAKGHEVVLVHGPMTASADFNNKSLQLEPVESALEMLDACERHWDSCDGLIAVAAVADYRPAEASSEKLKRGDSATMKIELIANPDIVATLAQSKGERLVVGFALESGDAEVARQEALRKMKDKGLDWVVLNNLAAQGARQSEASLLGKDGQEFVLCRQEKAALARQIVEKVLN